MMIYDALVDAAADLWAGADRADLDRNPEYLRGQVELIGDAMGVDKETVEADVRAAVANLRHPVAPRADEREWGNLT